MRYYNVNDDWITAIGTDFRAEFLASLRRLGLQRLQKFPPPKVMGLPFGNEGRILRRFLKGESSQLDASAFSASLLRLASAEDLLLYRAFRQTDHLTRAEWASILGDDAVDQWLRNSLLRQTPTGLIVARFCVVAVDNLVFAVDPLNDHGGEHENVALPEDFTPGEDDSDDIQPFHHTYIGQDSLRMIDVMRDYGFAKGGGGRYVDCGCGSGSILSYFSRFHKESVGIDINPRAVVLAQFNADLNELENCRTLEADALDFAKDLGRFDLVSWNLPFIFLPTEWQDLAIDAFGGELGIGLCLKFIATLPDVLSETGEACVAALAPILNDGTNVLEERLRQRLESLGLDCTIIVSQISLAHTQEIYKFHQSNNIAKFESVYLFLSHGAGKISRVEPPATRKMIDAVRVKLYHRKFA